MRNRQRTSFIEVAPHSDFSIYNIPFGIAIRDEIPRVVSRIGDTIIDLAELNDLGYFADIFAPPIEDEDDDLAFFALTSDSLNDFIDLGKPITRRIRERIIELLDSNNTRLKDNTDDREAIFSSLEENEMLLPVHIGDYTDFYSSRQHATNVGIMFRDPANALLPNWLHMPVGYHGRASSIVVSGTPIHRPSGQIKPPTADVPHFGATAQLDFELEMAFIVGKNTEMGDVVTTAAAEDHIFGCVLFNDWSARDIQAWEYVPLGPFLGKNFGSSMSAWVVTLEALEPFRTAAAPAQPTDPAILPYLQYSGAKHYDIALEVALAPTNGAETVICRSNFKHLYWTMVQQLAHHTVGGCNMRIGDVCASGTISGDTPDSFGSMLELTWRGTRPLTLADGSERKFVNDGDTVTMRGFGEAGGMRVGFGEVVGRIVGSK